METGRGVSGAKGSAAGWAVRARGAERRIGTAGFFLAAFFLADFAVGFFLPAFRAGAFLPTGRAPGLFAVLRVRLLFRDAFLPVLRVPFLAFAMCFSRQCRAATALLTTSRYKASGSR